MQVDQLFLKTQKELPPLNLYKKYHQKGHKHVKANNHAVSRRPILRPSEVGSDSFTFVLDYFEVISATMRAPHQQRSIT